MIEEKAYEPDAFSFLHEREHDVCEKAPFLSSLLSFCFFLSLSLFFLLLCRGAVHPRGCKRERITPLREQLSAAVTEDPIRVRGERAVNGPVSRTSTTTHHTTTPSSSFFFLSSFFLPLPHTNRHTHLASHFFLPTSCLLFLSLRVFSTFRLNHAIVFYFNLNERHLPYNYNNPCPFHSAGSSHTTYVPRASELVATAGRSLDYAPSLFHTVTRPPFSHTHSLGPHRHTLTAIPLHLSSSSESPAQRFHHLVALPSMHPAPPFVHPCHADSACSPSPR